MTIETTTRTSEAHGGHCAECNTFYNVSTSPYWAWNKSVAMHRSGTGHKVTLYRLVVA